MGLILLMMAVGVAQIGEGLDIGGAEQGFVPIGVRSHLCSKLRLYSAARAPYSRNPGAWPSEYEG